MFLVLPSFIAGLFMAVLLSDGAFIKVSECQVYDNVPGAGDFQMDNIGGVALSARAHCAPMSAIEAATNDYNDIPKFN
jgi:hypothetical protein